MFNSNNNIFAYSGGCFQGVPPRISCLLWCWVGGQSKAATMKGMNISTDWGLTQATEVSSFNKPTWLMIIGRLVTILSTSKISITHQIMVLIRVFSGFFPVVFLVVFHGFSHDFPWFSMNFHGFSMDFPWIFHDFPWFSMDFPWIFHGFPHDFPWVFHDFPWIFPWILPQLTSRRWETRGVSDRRQATARSGRSRIGGRTTRIQQLGLEVMVMVVVY